MPEKKPSEIMLEFLRATKDERAVWRRNAEEKLLNDILSDIWHDEHELSRGSPLNHWQAEHLKDFQSKNMVHARWALNSFNTLISPIKKSKDFAERRENRRSYIYARVCQALYGQKLPPSQPPIGRIGPNRPRQNKGG